MELVVGDVVIRPGAGTDEAADSGDPGGPGGDGMMPGHGGPVEIFVAMRPVDLRKEIDGLAPAVQEMFSSDPS